MQIIGLIFIVWALEQLLNSYHVDSLHGTTQNVFYTCKRGIKYDHAFVEITVSLGIAFAYLKL